MTVIRMKWMGAVALGLMTLVAAPVDASEPVALMRLGSSEISWQPVVADYEQLDLTVTGPGGFVHAAEFRGGNYPSFSLFDTGGDNLLDGSYSYELVVVPRVSSAARQTMLAARESGDASAEVQVSSWLDDPLVQSGHFRIQNGSVVANDGGTEEPAASPPRSESPDSLNDEVNLDGMIDDQIILDDLIVDGSICAGMDCVNGESFGFDTIRLNENNLRIRFVDTSSTSSFPSRDWQITANDSSNGGLNKFSIDDIDGGRTPFTIEAGAPSHSLYVDDSGRLGLGTSTPVVDLHVKTGNTPTLRLEQDGSSGFTPQTWDVAGNEANFFIRDATNGSTLPVRIRPGAPNSSIDIAADGNVGLGTDSPDQELDIEASGPNFRMTNTGTGGGIWDFRVDPDSGRLTVTDDGTGIRNPFKIAQDADNNLVKIGTGASNRVEINGDLYIGSTQVTPDYVFEPGYDLESIDEHGAFMWKNSHLPAMLPAMLDADEGHTVINIGSRSQGMLEELEKAHIYIEQLHKTITDLTIRVGQLEKK